MAFGLSINNSSYSPGTTYKSVSANAHTGALYKVKVFRDFYFTPSIDFYYSVLKHSITDSQTITTINNIFSIGPIIGFEYYFSDRISVNTDVINLIMVYYFQLMIKLPAHYLMTMEHLAHIRD
jgi:hypothetical protein